MEDRAERQARLTCALVEEAIATSAALQAVLARIYRRDPDSLAHVNRVAQLSLRIGAELGLAERALDDLERAAWIHDVGKLVVPDSDPADAESFGPHGGRLGGEQAATVHALTRRSPFLVPAGDLVLASRECFDGSGFPIGLSGAAIPIGSRILHVANVFDVMTSLCQALTVSADSVYAELVRYAGSRFDPDVVAAWLRCSDEPSVSVGPWTAPHQRQV
ncbi:MAG: HD-GYP domain-containing protein [Vicinamibacterales bacterium]